MNTIAYPEVNKLLEELLAQIKNILEDDLVGLYLYGSLVWEDFDSKRSDIDLLAVTSTDVTDKQFEDLNRYTNLL